MFFPYLLAVGQAMPAVPAANEVTVYNQGFALIKETRVVELRQGRQEVAIQDVAAMIEANSVGIRSLTDPQSLQVWEQNYQYDLISPIAILNKAVGQRIRFVRTLPNGQKEVLEGTLLSAPTAMVSNQQGQSFQTYQGMVIQTTDGRIVLNPTGEIEVTSLPEGLISRPTLLWDLVSSRAGSHRVELSYLTRGAMWNADYVLTLTSDTAADLKGWVTMTNNSGATWREANLKLLAGDVQRAEQFDRQMGRGGGGLGGAKAPTFQEESLFEYHLYTLQRPATIRDKEIKQLSLLEAHGLTFAKKLIVDSLRNFSVYYPGEGEVGTGPIKPQVRVEFVNSKENKMGMPLPMGNVKVYQRDKSGSVQMLGEDRIQHTPQGERLSLLVGSSFDVVAERKRHNFERLGPYHVRETFEIEVRNRKEVPETVHVIERHYGDWRITESSHPHEKLDAITQQYVLKLAAGQIQKIRYVVETRWR